MTKTLPSLQQRLKFIIENENILSYEIKSNILKKVMMEYEDDDDKPFWSSSTNEPLIDLNKIANKKIDLLNQIYKIVYARREEINKPLY